MLGFLWRATRGYRLAPWRSLYVRWRIETYWGLHADSTSDAEVRAFLWNHRGELMRFARWAGAMKRQRLGNG